MTDSGAEALMHAIVGQAVADWQRAVRKLNENWGDKDAARMQRECERFFCSDYCYGLTGIPPKQLLERVWRTVE